MKYYVLGFLFDDNYRVWLIEKVRPEWQKGKLNGIGGHVEINETVYDAMTREFWEETGFKIEGWEKFCMLTDKKTYEVYCFYNFSNELLNTTTDEKVGLYDSNNISGKTLPNLPWLITMAKTFEDIGCKPYEVIEKWDKVELE